MPYSNPTDVMNAYPKATTSGFTILELESRIADGDAFIDAALARRYMVPVAGTPETAPPLIRSLSKIMAMMDVFERSQNTPAWITRRIEWAQETLLALRDGQLQLVDTGGNRIIQRTDIGVVQSSTSGYTPTFGVAPALSETVDPDRANDEEDARD